MWYIKAYFNLVIFMRTQDIVEKAQNLYNQLSYIDNIPNHVILDKYKIIHGFGSDGYSQLPSDSFTIFLLFSKFYHDEY